MANNLKIYSNDGRETSYDIYADGVFKVNVPISQGVTLTSNFTAYSTMGHNTHCYIYETDNENALNSSYNFNDATLVDSFIKNDGTFVSGTKTYQITKQYVIICYDGNYGYTPYINIISETNCYRTNEINFNGIHGYTFYNFTGNPTITWGAGYND